MGVSKVATASVESGAGKALGFLDRTKRFLADVRTEMRKVTTPSMKEVRATTTVVIIAVAIFGLYFFLIDLAIGRGVNWALKYFTH